MRSLPRGTTPGSTLSRILALSALLTGCPGAKAARPAPPFPSWLDWPAPAADVERWVARKDVSRLRRHGWYLWAGVNTPGPDGRPRWLSWPTLAQAFAPTAGSAREPPPLAPVAAVKAATTLEGMPYYVIPERVRALYRIPEDTEVLPDGEVFQSSGHILLASVAYNDDAFAALRAQGLHRSAELARRRSRGDRELGGLPRTSIVLKHMYWPVRRDGPSALPVWDDAPPPRTPVYAGYETWKRAVAVDAQGRHPVGRRRRVSLLHDVFREDGAPFGPVTWEAEVVPLESFYRRSLSLADLRALAPRDRALLDAAAWWAYGRVFEPGDWLVSVAMHITTRERPGWTFQSLWWHDRPDRGPYAADRPDLPVAAAPGPWRHYLMTSTCGIQAELVPGQPARWPVAYNPFIELALGHPIDTSCIACHARAGWPAGSGGASYDDGPGRLDARPSGDPYFEGLLRTDYQWAIPDRATP